MNTQTIAERYDDIAGRYDDLWTRHVCGPQDRLTEALALRAGERVCDLACGTGAQSVDMARLVAPAEVVAVDCSEAMVQAARARAAAEGLTVTAVQATLEEFVAAAPPESFDVLSLRFCLAYVDWRALLPGAARLLRPGGRLGLLTSLATSAPQAYAVYRELQREFALPSASPNVPAAPAEIGEALAGVPIHVAWTETFRLTFDSGRAAARWLWESGYAVHEVVGEISPAELGALADLFSARLERSAGPDGVVLDFQVAGVVAGP